MSDDGLILCEDGLLRCDWAAHVPEFAAYHDEEWGFPVDDEHRLFEKICLEGFQSGLSWRTVLNKRPAFRELFHDFNFERIARFDESDVQRLLGDARIIRHRGKIEATINNAQRACDVVDRYGSLGDLVWRFEPSAEKRPDRVRPETRTVTFDDSAKALAKALKKEGWRFFGPTTAYAFMQAMGLVNDHLHGCVVRERCETARDAFARPSGR